MDDHLWTNGAIDLTTGAQLSSNSSLATRTAVIVDAAAGPAGPAEPIAGVWLAWDDLAVDVEVSNGLFKAKTRKTIVHQSRGRAGPGEVLAVMGPSGAGKTSLFSSLAKRGTGYTTRGSATLNGLPYGKEELSKIAGFVFQEAVFHTHMLVEEALRLAAALKLPKSMSKAEKERRVQVLLDAFDLRKCARTRIGDAKSKGISGGEKKRLSIAIEVLRGEPLVFLDEPTTGLDAASSLMVIKLLRELADNGTTVVMVLHGPRAQILKSIDRFLILSDGRDVFFGGLQAMCGFFERVKMPIPLRVNPLDYVLDLVNTNEMLDDMMGPASGGSEKKDTSFAQILRGDQATRSFAKIKKMSLTDAPEPQHHEHAVNRRELAVMLAKEYRASGIFEAMCEEDPKVLPPLKALHSEGSAFGTRLGALLQREFRQKVRNPEVLMTQMMGAVVLGLIMGSIYWRMGPLNVFNKTAAISFAGVMCLFLVFHLILTFPVERVIWLRDRDNGLYNSLEYYSSVVLAGIPGDIVSSSILATILYWMFGLNANAGVFFTWVGFFILTISVGSSLLYLGGSVAPSPSVANSLVSVILMFVMLFNGFFVVYSTIPVWYRWIAEINFLRFALNVFYFGEFAGQQYNCTVGVDGCFYATGNDVLVNLGIPVDLQVWRMAVYMLIVWAVFHSLAWLGVTFCYTHKHQEMARAVRDRKRAKARQLELAERALDQGV